MGASTQSLGSAAERTTFNPWESIKNTVSSWFESDAEEMGSELSPEVVTEMRHVYISPEAQDPQLKELLKPCRVDDPVETPEAAPAQDDTVDPTAQTSLTGLDGGGDDYVERKITELDSALSATLQEVYAGTKESLKTGAELNLNKPIIVTMSVESAHGGSHNLKLEDVNSGYRFPRKAGPLRQPVWYKSIMAGVHGHLRRTTSTAIDGERVAVASEINVSPEINLESIQDTSNKIRFRVYPDGRAELVTDDNANPQAPSPKNADRVGS